jgi:hypothetical protein
MKKLRERVRSTPTVFTQKHRAALSRVMLDIWVERKAHKVAKGQQTLF